jgi:hypothetical protein
MSITKSFLSLLLAGAATGLLTAQIPEGDPRKAEVPMPAASGWTAFHIHTTDSRVVVTGTAHFTDYHGSPQVIVLDENGRCTILQSDSGKWRPEVVVEDGALLGAWAFGDLDAQIDGPELYVGGQNGNLYQIRHGGRRGYSTDLVATAPGASLGKFVIADLDPSHEGEEILAFSTAGPVFQLSPDPASDTAFLIRQVGSMPARVRDAVVLAPLGARPPRIAAVVQTGEVSLVTFADGRFDRTVLAKEPMSLARMARKLPRSGDPEVIYVARVDGLILRFAERNDGIWARELIFAGPQGPRGLVSGRFDADREAETVAVYGYSRKVYLLSRLGGGPWRVESIFTDIDRGHWLAGGEIDGRNATDELVGGGFGHHVFLLAREPGYGLDGVPIDPGPPVPPDRPSGVSMAGRTDVLPADTSR